MAYGTPMQKKAFVLLSGGLDSTTCLYKAMKDFNPNPDRVFFNPDSGCYIGLSSDGSAYQHQVDWVEAVSVNYGQRHKREMDFAKKTCDKFGIKHTILELKDILGGAMLTDQSIEVPDKSYAEITGVSPTYVPFRNGTLLSLITAYAQKWVTERINEQAKLYSNTLGGDIETNMLVATRDAKDLAAIYFGAHSEDAANWAYPDCTPEFIGAMANAIYIGSYNTIRLHTPLQWLMKSEIVELGHKLGVPFEDTWSCYKGGDKHCGTCMTCRSRKEAFEIAEVDDPTEYAA